MSQKDIYLFVCCVLGESLCPTLYQYEINSDNRNFAKNFVGS